MKTFRRLFAGAAIAALFAGSALAGPLPYVNVPMDTPQALANAVISTLNSALPQAQIPAACSGTTTATCTGLKIVVSVTGLTTAAGATSASMAVTDSAVTASSLIFCQVVGYGGTGNPQPVNVVPTASTITFAIQNTHASAALNATVPVVCFVYN